MRRMEFSYAFKMSPNISLFLLLLYVVNYSTSKNLPPEKLTENKEHDMTVCSRLFHLNMIILKDVILKIREAEKMQMKYKGAMGYELGIIVAGIVHNWKGMLTTYKKMADQSVPGVMFKGYQKIHGLYMQLLVDTDVFRKVAFEHEKKLREKQRDLDHKKRELQKQAFKNRNRKGKKSKTGLRMRNIETNIQANKDREVHQKKQYETTTKLEDKPDVREKSLTRNTKRKYPSDREYKRRLRMQKYAEIYKHYDPKQEEIDR